MDFKDKEAQVNRVMEQLGRAAKKLVKCSMCDELVLEGEPMCEACYQWLREGVQ